MSLTGRKKKKISRDEGQIHEGGRRPSYYPNPEREPEAYKTWKRSINRQPAGRSEDLSPKEEYGI